MKKFYFFFGITAWIISLIVHLLSLSGYDVSAKIPFIWILHVTIFVVWVPMIIELKNNNPIQQSNGFLRGSHPQMLTQIFKNAPRWLVVLSISCIAYAVINFILFFITQEGTPEIMNGLYVLMDHGRLIKTLTAAEYHHYKANELRGFSGHWLMFYIIGAAALYPFKKEIAVS